MRKNGATVWARVIKLAILLSALMAPVSRAEVGGSDLDGRRAEAAAHYAQGLELANQGRYQEALDEFNAAYSASPHFAVLYNVGQAQMALGRPIDAIAALTRYLQEGADQVPVSRRELVRAQIALLEAKLAELTITSAQPGVSVRVDDRQVGQTPLLQPVRLAAGTHAVTASPPRGAPVTRQVTLAEGERRELQLVFAPPVAPPPPAREPPLSAPAPSISVEAKRPSPVITLRRAAIVTVAAGLLMGGAALGIYAWNRGRYEEWQNTDASLRHLPQETTDYQKDAIANNELAGALATANDAIVALSVAAGALAATGAVLYIVDRAHRSRTGELAVAYANSPSGKRTPIVGWSVAW